jgi:Heparinase II/III-like protein
MHGCRPAEILLPGGDLREELALYAYRDFGLYIFRSRRLYLAVRCAPINPACHGAHAHNDQLGIELSVDGEDRMVDPGTYLYTPLPSRRNAYRSVNAHWAPRCAGREPSSLDVSLFKLEDTARAQCLYFGEEGFVGAHDGYGFRVRRVIEIGREQLRIIDFFDAPAHGANHLPPTEHAAPPAFSPGYGRVLRR